MCWQQKVTPQSCSTIQSVVTPASATNTATRSMPVHHDKAFTPSSFSNTSLFQPHLMTATPLCSMQQTADLQTYSGANYSTSSSSNTTLLQKDILPISAAAIAQQSLSNSFLTGQSSVGFSGHGTTTVDVTNCQSRVTPKVTSHPFKQPLITVY